MSAGAALTEEGRAQAGERWPGIAVACAWLALAILGEQVAIALYAPGAWQLGLRPPGELARHAWAVGIVVAMALGGGIALARLLSVAAGGARRMWYLALVGVLWAVGTTLLARSPVDYAVHAVLTAALHMAGLACMVFAARSLPDTFALRGALAGEGDAPWVVAVFGALFATLVAALVAWLTFHRIPHVPDEVAYVFQARTYAHGRAYLAPPPTPELFRQFLIMVHDGKWFGVFPPGWPLVLSLGVVAGAPWVVNPLLGGAGVLLVYRVVTLIHTRLTAIVATLLVATSPLYVTVSATYMAHTLSIVCALVALLSVLELRRGARTGWAVIGGAALGLLFITRPIEGVSVGLVILAMCMGAFGRRVGLAAVAAAVAVMVALSSVFFINNWLLTGNPLRDPVQMFFDVTFYPGSNRLGFGPDRGNFGWATNLLPGHSPLEALAHVNMNVSMIDTELFGWLGGALLFVVALLFTRRERGAWLWFWLIVAVVAPTTLYWYSGVDLGPRYWYQTLVPLAVLTALGMRALAERIGTDERCVAAVALCLALAGFFQITAWRAGEKYVHYRGVRADVGTLIRENGMQHGLIFVKDGSPPNDFADYASGFIWSGVPLGTGPLVARYGDPALMAELTARFPDRRVWVIAPSAPSGSYGIVVRPGDTAHARE